MDLFLRHQSTGLYVKPDGELTPDRSLARHFRNGSSAVDFVIAMHLTGLDLVVSFGDARFDIVISLVKVLGG